MLINRLTIAMQHSTVQFHLLFKRLKHRENWSNDNLGIPYLAVSKWWLSLKNPKYQTVPTCAIFGGVFRTET